ncbi:hypothetical protein TREAZ_0467 [Leadbettera azotonutricia ZAS-9]|uniref:PilZN3 domain-containing protein n=2 Tax=Leadbettera azotonutricia TaxID=150829 RepID=F5YCA2_LEAAZ|nr:hypothetical protein TREAZ_0467 [Leadbettera azotonutricia ZAS-9]
MARFSESSIPCNQYALAKLGVDRAHCSLKIEEYVILCVPFQLGFKRSIFLASLSVQELTFFQRYVNGIVGLSIALNPEARPEPVKFFIRCNLSTIGQMKGRENVGLFVVDFKTSPDEMINILGNFMDTQDRIKMQYEDYGKKSIRITPDVAKAMGYNMYATIIEPKKEARRIQIYSLSSKTVEHMEAPGAPLRPSGSPIAYQFYFKKYRVSAAGIVSTSETLPQGIVRTTANLAFSPELVEIIDDYWYNLRVAPAANASGKLSY